MPSRWKLTNTDDIEHLVISIKKIRRPVSVTPNFTHPVHPESGSKSWQEETALDVLRDEDRFRREERNPRGSCTTEEPRVWTALTFLQRRDQERCKMVQRKVRLMS